MNRLIKNIRKKSIYNSQKNKIHMNKITTGSENPLQWKVQVIEERTQRRLEKMERYPMLMDWHNQYCENGYITKSNLHVQCNSHWNSNDIHHRDENSTAWVAKAILSKHDQCWRYHNIQIPKYYTTIAIKIAWCWHRNRHEEQN
jgi:hypothetical protein